MSESAIQKKLANFVENMLNSEPEPSKVKVNEHANNSKYLPIQVVEDDLNTVFYGLWETVNFKWEVIVNELVGSIDLRVYHPVTGQWITRSGGGAVVIQQSAKWITDENGKKKKVSAEITDIGRKIRNTLVKDVGHLKSECIKNAAKSLGRRFGSELNRDKEERQRILTQLDMIAHLKKVNTLEELQETWASLGNWNKQDIETREIFEIRAGEIRAQLPEHQDQTNTIKKDK